MTDTTISFLVPTWYEVSLDQIPLSTLKEKGIRTIFCDLDNTLVPYYESLPTEDAIRFITDTKAHGLTLCVISNNHQRRVENFCKSLDILYLWETKKPRKFRLISFMETHNFSIDSSLIIGDQLLTDILLAHHIGCRSLLVEPTVSHDLLVTRLNRMIDKRLRSYMKQHNLLKPVKEETYGR